MREPLPPRLDKVIEVNATKAAAAMAHINALLAKEPSEELEIAAAGLKTYVGVCAYLGQRGVSIAGLRRFLGIKPAPFRDDTPRNDRSPDENKGDDDQGDDDTRTGTDQNDDLQATSDSDQGGEDDGKAGRPRKRGAADFPDAERVYFAHPEFDAPGCECVHCIGGRVYLVDYGEWHRFSGQPYLKVTLVYQEAWRCGTCGAYYVAPLPAAIEKDGGHREFGFSAIAMIAITKYFAGTPWTRQDRLLTMLELSMPPSTQWNQCNFLAQVLRPIYVFLIRLAALAWLYFSDDTGIKITGQQPVIKVQRTTGKEVERYGTHTSCILADLDDGHRLFLFKSGIIHAGEFLDEILAARPLELTAPYHMSDGSSCNPPTVRKVVSGSCNAHARRKVEEKEDNYPDIWAYIKAVYKLVYKNDAYTKTENMTPVERRDYHAEHSRPAMRAMFEWMLQQFTDKVVEPNSDMGGIFNYFLDREKPLMAFTRYPGFPIDNNPDELAIKVIALLRKNALYFRSQNGADAADVILSVGATVGHAQANIFDYFTSCMRFTKEVEASPGDFLPWNYQETVKRLEARRIEDPPIVLQVSEEEFLRRQRELRVSGKALHPPKAKRPDDHHAPP